MIKRLLFCFLFFVSAHCFSQCPLQVNIDREVSCYDGNDGQITVTSSSSGIYEFHVERWIPLLNNWVPFSFFTLNFPATIQMLESDSFRVWVDGTLDSINNAIPNGCVSPVVFISEPPELTLSTTAFSDESAPGACDGSISTFMTGGTPSYNYSWTGPNGFTSNNQNINNLCAGNYELTVSDTNNCTTTLNQTISSAIICDIFVDSVEHVICPGISDGSAVITNGSASFQIFSWDNLSDGQNYGNGPATSNYNLATGWYRVTGTDVTGNCPPSQSDSFYVAEAMPFIQSAQAACIGDSIQLSVDLLNPKAGVQYSFSVNGNANTYIMGASSLEYLQIGNHYYTLFADTGSGNFSCGSQPFPFVISGINPLNISVDSNLETCRGNDANIIVNAAGGGGVLNYSIDGGNTFFSNSVFSNLIAGNYNIFVQESGACIQPYANNPVNIGITPINHVVDSVVAVEESCCGNDGRIQVFTSGTDSFLSYSADSMFTWQDSAKFHFLSEGNYYVVVEDTNGCKTDWGYVGVTTSSTPDIDMSVHVTDIICNADTNGTFRVLYPDSCYSYALWRYTISPPYYIPVDTGTYFNGLIPGSYGVIATSNTGNCIDSSLAVVIDEPTQLIQNGIEVQEVRCSNNGICDGEINLSAAPTGGTPPYYYSILDYGSNIPFGPISSDSTFSGLCTDSFEVSLFDANACKVIDIVFVPDSTLYIDSIVTTHVSCFGFANGSAIVYAYGGYTPYSYIWTSGDSSMQTDSLTNMQYSVIVSDAQNCVAYDTINITQPRELFFNIKVVDGFKPESCKGVSYDGEFYMKYQGGTAPFNWSWVGTSGNNNSGFGDTIGNLTFDTLTLFVTDANACIGEPAWIHADSARVDALNALNPLVLDTVITDSILCYGSATASIFIDVKSGEEVFSYSIDSGQTFTNDSSFINLSAGNYHIEVRDTFGCAVYTQVDIKQAAEIIIFKDSIKHISCYDGTDGYLSVSAEGGYAPYIYLWDPTNSINNFINNLAVGMYTVSVSDIVGCTKVDSFSVVELTLPLLSNAVVTANASCNDSANASATISVQGGMLPYTIDWNGVDNNALTAGTYIITINDSFNCGPIYDTVEILEPTPFLIQTTSITANPCFGDALGLLTLSASGGTMPYAEYYARDEQSNIIMVYLPTISGLGASNYDLWSIDANGCPSDTLKGVKVGEPGAIQININNHTNATCYQLDDGALDLYLISGTSPYSYVLSSNGNTIAQGNISQTASLIFDELSADQYLLSISDSNDCQKDSLIEVIEPNEVVADFSSDNISGQESFTVNLTNMSQGADIFVWDYDDGNQDILAVNEMPTHTYNKQGQYEIMLIAENSALSSACNDTAFQIIDVQGFDVFNVFTPNGDGLNDVFTFDDWDLSSLYVEIYNRWGERVYHWDATNGSWNGIAYNGDKAPEGVYYFYLKASGIDGYLYEQEGSITLLR